ncbi:pyridoxal phosphate-dependent transferase [Podospora conica]|nr:pyridoxal phosphate-dependent transferase [Schizothecium conicum]
MASTEDITHQAISSYFIGPRAENLAEFRNNISVILDEIQFAREKCFKEDVENGYTFISPSVQESDEFKRVTAKVAKAVQQTARLLGQHSIPYWSPRYQGHMCTDLTVPSLLGYFMTMIYNPNNVALEVSPITTVAEMEVGEQIKNEPKGWAHITSGGTVANLEALWVARNLKFYPLAIRKAMDDADGPLRFLPDGFKVRTCQGRSKSFRELSTWELLNLRPKTILDIPDRLYSEFGITPTFLNEALDQYKIQTSGKGVLARHFGVERIEYITPATAHYSWPKAGAVLGIGSANMTSIAVDHAGKLDLGKLEKYLEGKLERQEPVYSVVADIGSTEEGAVDPLVKILSLRQHFQAKGLSFLVHADAAWGGYFRTMLPVGPEPAVDSTGSMAGRDGGSDGLVPDLALRVETQEDLFALRYCDSITVDPHKAGYIPYPSGVLAYRDGRIRSQITWTAPVLSMGSTDDTSIGIYGVEGSKPGAAAMATWLSNRCIGLHPQGCGALLSEACYSSSRISALWAALATHDDSFIIVPFNMLPSEESGDAKAIEVEKQRIRDEILTKTNAELVANNQGKKPAERTMTLLRALGSDLNINAFALNWRHPNGTVNTDVEEANYLMRRVVRRLSVDSPNDKPAKIPLFLTSTEFSPALYGECLANFKKRLGLETSDDSMMVLRNVVMSPFASLSSKGDFINMLGETFKQVLEEEVKVCQARNDGSPDYHSFLIHGTDSVFLVYRPMFNIAKHSRQIIIAVELDEDGGKAYRALKGNTEETIILKSANKIDLDRLIQGVESGERTTFVANLMTESNGMIHSRLQVSLTRILKNRSLQLSSLSPAYPFELFPFYIYGTLSDAHIDHILTRSPNITLSASSVLANDTPSPSPSDSLTAALASGAILTLSSHYERPLQPFPSSNDALPSPFFFRPGAEFAVKIWADPAHPSDSIRGVLERVAKQEPLATGTVTLGEDVVVDVEKLNRDPWGEEKDFGDKVAKWRKRFKSIADGGVV